MDTNAYDNTKNKYGPLYNTLTALSIVISTIDVTTERYQTLCLSYVWRWQIQLYDAMNTGKSSTRWHFNLQLVK